MKLPNVLYHYTRLSTFKSILNSGNVRLTLLDNANDSEEGRWLTKILQKRISARRWKCPVNTDLVGLLQDIRESALGFSFCLSEERDLLSQWRAYGDDGTGVAIGFNFEWLRKISEGKAIEKGPAVQFGSVNYMDSERETYLDEWLQKWSTLSETKDREDEFANHGTQFLLQSYFEKHRAFEAEQEWRLLAGGTLFAEESDQWKSTKWLDRDGLPLPYKELPLIGDMNGIISKIYVGPKSKDYIASIKILACQHGINPEKVTASEIPYC